MSDSYYLVIFLSVILVFRMWSIKFRLSPAKIFVWLAYAGLLLYFCLQRPELVYIDPSGGFNSAFVFGVSFFALCWFSWFEGFVLGFAFYCLFTQDPFHFGPGAPQNLVIAVVILVLHLVLNRHDPNNSLTSWLAWIWGTLLSLLYAGYLAWCCGLFSFSGGLSVPEPTLASGSFLVFLSAFLLSRRESWYGRTRR